VVKWTVLLLSNKEFSYIENQLKILYEFNNSEDFELLIIENGSKESFLKIEKISKTYIDKYSNLRVIFFEDDINQSDLEVVRGDSIEFGKKIAKGSYVMVQDAGFFWLKNNYLGFIEEYLKKGFVAVGASDLSKVGIGSKSFPASYGCAYLKKEILDVSFCAEKDSEVVAQSKRIFPEFLGYGDVLGAGYKVRAELSLKNHHRFMDKIPLVVRVISYFCRYFERCDLVQSDTKYYFDGSQIIAAQVIGKKDHYQVLDEKEKKLVHHYLDKIGSMYANIFYTLLKTKCVPKPLNIYYGVRFLGMVISSAVKGYLISKSFMSDILSFSAGKRKWTIGMVNYKTLPYLGYQLKILYEFNDPREFKLVIVDNSYPSQKKELEEIIAPYASYNNVEIVPHTPTYDKDLKGSLDHAEGLNIVLDKADTPYLLVHDPDFFWVKKNYLKFFESKILQGFLVVGAPYLIMVKIGKPNFPAAFGCAFSTHLVKKNNLNFDIGKNLIEVGKEHKDVGWKMREFFSSKPFISFIQKSADITGIFGAHSYAVHSVEYFYNKEKIAYHLFRGSFVDDEKNHKNASLENMPPESWDLVRRKYAELFYMLAKGHCRKKIIKRLNK